MSQDKDHLALREQWFAWNLDGKGKEKHSIGKYRYDGPILYCDEHPSQRLIPRHPAGLRSKDFALMVRNYGSRIPAWATNRVVAIHVPDIACFSSYDGDRYDDAGQIHDRSKYIMLLRTIKHVEGVKAYTGKALAENSYLTKSIRETLDKYYRNWADYRSVFGLDWTALPEFYRQQMESTIKSKIDAWQDPAAVTKRARQAARKAAKEALGLNA